MKKDRKEICRIISEMLDNPGECEIYPTGKAYDALESYVEEVRIEAIGWAYADCCVDLDRGKDPRTTVMPAMLLRAKKDLGKEEE